MSEPEVGVDVVIAVHDARRPIARAVRSVLDHNGEGVRLTIVCHGIASTAIANELDSGHADRVRFLEHNDGHASPAGPFNAGIEAASADYIAIMGSDDELAPGAVASWYWLAKDSGADAVIARLEHTGGAVVPTPPTRPLRRRRLHLVKDRLSYRSAPLGLVSRAIIERLGLRMDPKVVVGEDVAFVTRLWSSGRIAFDRTGPAYRIGADAADRVSMTARSIAKELKFVRRLLPAPWFTDLDQDSRRSVCLKLTRIHLFGAVHNRQDPLWWTPQQREDLSTVAQALLRAAPGMETSLSLADRDLLDSIMDTTSSATDLIDHANARRRHGHPRTLLTREPWRMFGPQAPLRLMVASVLTR